MNDNDTDWSEIVFYIMLGLVVIALIVAATVRGIYNPNPPCQPGTTTAAKDATTQDTVAP